MMANFDKAVRRVLENEGELSNTPEDKGGETKYGISKSAYPHLDIKSLTIDDALKIYYEDYWLRLKLDRVASQRVATYVLDMSVNLGRCGATLIVQKALNLVCDAGLEEDCIFGPKTLKAVNQCHHVGTPIGAMKGLRFMHYYNIITKDPTQRVFIRGWINRALEE